jgi:hypothetical protein
LRCSKLSLQRRRPYLPLGSEGPVWTPARPQADWLPPSDPQRQHRLGHAFVDWVLRNWREDGVEPEEVIGEAAATLLAARLKTPLQIGQHLARAFEAGFEIGARPIDDLEPRLTRNGYDVRSLAEQFDARPAEIRRLLRGDLDPARSAELIGEMRAAGLPT